MLTRWLSGVLTGAVFLAAVACNGGDDAPQGSPLPSGRTPAPAAPKGAHAASKLAAKFLAGVDGRYEYRYTGALGSVTEGTLTVYRLGVNDRQDWTQTAFGIESTTGSILDGDKNYTCAVAQSYSSCLVATVQQVESLRFISAPIYDALAALVTERDKFKFEDLPDEGFAGITGNCYRASSDTRSGAGPPASENIKACFKEDGAVLYFERAMTPDSAALESSTFTIELQSRNDALISDFEPPGRVQ